MLKSKKKKINISFIFFKLHFYNKYSNEIISWSKKSRFLNIMHNY